MGDEIGRTANTGEMGKRVRRDALHFAILYSRLPEWSNDGEVVTPKDSYFMDPVAFYRLVPPYDSAALAGLPADRKGIDVPFMTQDGALVPPGRNGSGPISAADTLAAVARPYAFSSSPCLSSAWRSWL